MLIDTHAHLDSPRFDNDREEVISRSLSAGVEAIITIGTDLDSSRKAIALAQQYPHIYAAVGIHPHEASAVERNSSQGGQAYKGALTELVHLSQYNTVVAIGEIGLDFYRNLSPPDLQRALFIAQLELAQQLHKPVIIHDRQAHVEIMAILQDKARTLRGVLHCFSGDYDMAVKAIKMGFYISFAGPVTFQNARRLQQLACELPLERILIETDCPYLAPHPYRGQRNEPAHVRLIASKIAVLRKMPFEQVAEITTANAKRLFGLGTSE